MRVRWTWLRSVEGWAGRRNDVLYGCRDAMGAGEGPRHLVVLFPGDLMASRDQDGDARAPSYEHAANDMLANDEDAGALVLVRPYDNSRGVAVYDNFVDVDEATGCALMQDPRGHATVRCRNNARRYCVLNNRVLTGSSVCASSQRACANRRRRLANRPVRVLSGRHCPEPNGCRTCRPFHAAHAVEQCMWCAVAGPRKQSCQRVVSS